MITHHYDLDDRALHYLFLTAGVVGASILHRIADAVGWDTVEQIQKLFHLTKKRKRRGHRSVHEVFPLECCGKYPSECECRTDLDCSRCHKTIPGSAHHTHGMTAGYYDVRGNSWSEFARPGEEQVCDACMWADPKFIAVYGVHKVWELYS